LRPHQPLCVFAVRARAPLFGSVHDYHKLVDGNLTIACRIKNHSKSFAVGIRVLRGQYLHLLVFKIGSPA
jgi:hypothetical protein